MNSNFTPCIDKEALASIKRCTRCILPVTFPFLGIDDSGECIYCRTHKKREFPGKKALEMEVEKRLSRLKADREYDCIVPFSGGRDSSFILHFVKNELGLRPLAYTYDWGMTTGAGYRNIKTMTERLGIRRIVVDDGIDRKRRNIRKNVEAWLKSPDIATVTLFMAGNKQVYFHLPRLARESGTDIVFWGTNYLERTDFKTGFLGVNEPFEKKDYIRLGLWNRLRTAFAFFQKMSGNPAFFNASLLDSFTGFLGYYFYPKDYVGLFNFLPWNEEEINTTLEGYGWEKEEGYPSTWRIGDGTSALYNYIYARVAGFSENDTFRSNQIREGYITRTDALQKALSENMPRKESLDWYFRTIGVDGNRALSIINTMERLY